MTQNMSSRPKTPQSNSRMPPVSGDWLFHQSGQGCTHRPVRAQPFFSTYSPKTLQHGAARYNPERGITRRRSPNLHHHRSKAHRRGLLACQAGQTFTVSHTVRKPGSDRPQALPAATLHAAQHQAPSAAVRT